MSYDAAASRREYAADDLQQSGFTRTVTSNNADGLAPLYLNANVLDRREFAEVLPWPPPGQTLQPGGDKLLEPVAWGIVDPVTLAEVAHTNRDVVRVFPATRSPSHGERVISVLRGHRQIPFGLLEPDVSRPGAGNGRPASTCQNQPPRVCRLQQSVEMLGGHWAVLAK